MELNDGKIKVIAYYLPQYYPFKENDEWWGKGFTEWTNVGKAKPLFRGHYQPKVPADLGYYDLRVPEVAEEQAELAREAGVIGFCYWHYWFGNGRTLLEMPIQRVLKTGKPDFPFCFSWANHSWLDKAFNSTGTDKMLMEQLYPGEKDNEEHFYHCLDAFKDKRYMRYNGCPVFLIFDAVGLPNAKEFINQWNYLIKNEGVAEKFYFIAYIFSESYYKDVKSNGFDCVTFVGDAVIKEKYDMYNRVVSLLKKRIDLSSLIGPTRYDYNKIIQNICVEGFLREDVIPTVLPNWDHTPRSGRKGSVYVNATPKNFERLAERLFDYIKNKQNKIIMLKAWNEWGEGNYMEPDLKYGHGFMDALRQALNRAK
jgi:hypothetical protein